MPMLPCASKKEAHTDTRERKLGGNSPEDSASVMINVKKQIDQNAKANKELLIHFIGERDSLNKHPRRRAERPPTKGRKHSAYMKAARPSVKPEEKKAAVKNIDSSDVTKEEECCCCEAVSVAPTIHTTVFIGANQGGKNKTKVISNYHCRSRCSPHEQVKSDESKVTNSKKESSITDEQASINPKWSLKDKVACARCVLGSAPSSEKEKSNALSTRIFWDISRREFHKEDD